jgi:hypothetical protein
MNGALDSVPLGLFMENSAKGSVVIANDLALNAAPMPVDFPGSDRSNRAVDPSTFCAEANCKAA